MRGKEKTARKARTLSLRKTVALMVIMFLTAAGGTLIAYTIYMNVFVTVFDIHFEVSDSRLIGINADANLHFGKVPQGSTSSVKEMNLLNDYSFPVLVHFDIEGSAAPFIHPSEEDFVLQPGEHRVVKWIVSVTDQPLGEYTGKVIVSYKRL